jgi:flagellar protein FliO/FliZ
MSAFLQAILTAGAALGAVLGIIVLAGRGARMLRLAQPTVGRRLILREALALDRTRRLHLVACDGRELLLMTGGGTDQFVAWLSDAQPSAASIA